MYQVLDVWYEASQHPMSSVFDLHTYDTTTTSDSVVKSQKGKVKHPCFLCKDMHFTYIFPCMDEYSKFLEYIIVSCQWLPTGYRKLSLEIPLVDKVVNPNPSLVDPTLSLKSEVKMVDPTLLSKNEVKVVDLS